MGENNVIIPQTEQRFAETVTNILKSQGYSPVSDTEVSGDHGFLMQKNAHIYCVMIEYSRARVFSAANAAAIYNRLELLWQTNRDWIPFVVAGGEIAPSLRAEFQTVNLRTQVADIRDLLYMAEKSRELYDELVAYLPYSVSGLTPLSPEDASGWGSGGNSSGSYTDPPLSHSAGTSDTRGAESSGFDSSYRGIIDGDDRYRIVGHCGTGKTRLLSKLAERQTDSYSGELCRELAQWKGGRGTRLSIEYENLCTRVLKHLYHEDLTLWEQQVKSNSELYRFDLICKIKQGNQKDFWEMAERYFRSKYIIFEFKNYSGTVTQMEVTTTARYLYTKALRSVAIIVSPNGFSEHADKAARGALREEGKLILSLTNSDLIEMLQLPDHVNGPADYLSTKLDTLLINLEK